jgi:hypothetical protein
MPLAASTAESILAIKQRRTIGFALFLATRNDWFEMRCPQGGRIIEK